MPETPLENIASEVDIVKQPTTAGSFQLKPAPLKKPFADIALALSGGGFRAASYSLGTMSYLHSLRYPGGTANQRVLDNVVFISSASGGTFTGMLYSMHVRQGKRFEDTYAAMLQFMQGQNLLEKVLQLINTNSEWTEGKSQNMINAFARVYNKDLFEKETFGVYWQLPDTIATRQLEVCFNATEFYRGLSFRFQTNNSDIKSKTGNEYLFFNTFNATHLETLKKVRLGDIMAASSCFPAGFEPILFPKDFAYGTGDGGLNKDDLKAAMVVEDYNSSPIDYKKDIGFMDGGINDNQGVYSAMVADERRRKPNADGGFGLMLVTDVGSYFMDPYIPPATPTSQSKNDNINTIAGKWRRKINTAASIINWVIIISLVLLVAALVLLFAYPAILPYGLCVAVASVSGTLLVLGLVTRKWVLGDALIRKLRQYLGMSEQQTVELLQEEVAAVRNFSSGSIALLVHYLRNTPLPVLSQMLMARVNSMLSLVLDINLKQTRRLIFDIFYGNFYGSNTWQHRRVFNVIYELSKLNTQNRLKVLTRKFNSKEYKLPTKDNWAQECISTLTEDSETQQQIAENARTMGTTLWFDESNVQSKKLPDLLACGQFTTCAKLLEYTMIVERVIELQKANPQLPKTIDFDDEQLAIFQDIKKQIERDWQLFKTNPHFLTAQYGQLVKN